VDLKLALAKAFSNSVPTKIVHLAVLKASEAAYARACNPSIKVFSFEEFRDENQSYDLETEKLRLLKTYPTVNWSSVLLSERSFFDVCDLQGGIGQRRVTLEYTQRLLIELIQFSELLMRLDPSVMVAQTPDSLMTLVLYKIAHSFSVPVRGLSPAWITPSNQPSGFLTEDEFLHSPSMQHAFDRYKKCQLTDADIARAEDFRKDITIFDANAVYKTVTGVSFGRSAISPNIKNIFNYISQNRKRREEVEYFKFSIKEKITANIKRFYRKKVLNTYIQKNSRTLPNLFVFLPFHFQPEASTLVGGIGYADQAALAEMILKTLPFGWSLVIKEHPAGRGTRPISHYKRLLSYPNVVFSDENSKYILKRCDAVITVTGTIGLEALAFDKPVLMFGNWFWDFSDLIYKISSLSELEKTLREILLDRLYEKQENRERRIQKALVSYLDGLIPYPLQATSAQYYVTEILNSIRQNRT